MDKTKLGNRMKEYEKTARTTLMRRSPVIIRLDGKGFSKFTKGFEKPFDGLLMKTMEETAKFLCENIQGCKVAYTQSDEITLLLTDYEKLTTDGWFGNQIQKMTSVSASMATLAFNKAFSKNLELYFEDVILNYENTQEYKEDEKRYSTYIDREMTAMFDSRVFSIPKEEVNNCFLWRQQDATKNSVSMVAQANFSHKELQNKNGSQMQDMLMLERGLNWNDIPTSQKRGTCIVKEEFKVGETMRKRWVADNEIPIFSKDKDYIEQYI